MVISCPVVLLLIKKGDLIWCNSVILSYLCALIEIWIILNSWIIVNIMKKHYETIFIVSPLVTDTQLKETVARFRKLMTNGGGEIVHEEDWGLRKFAYPIKKKSSGYYHLIEFKATPELIQKIETEYNRDELILRYLTVTLEKYGIEYNAKRRREGKKTPEVVEENKDSLTI